MTAPVASGWSGCRVGLAPTGKRRLFTAHTQSSPSPHAIGDPEAVPQTPIRKAMSTRAMAKSRTRAPGDRLEHGVGSQGLKPSRWSQGGDCAAAALAYSAARCSDRGAPYARGRLRTASAADHQSLPAALPSGGGRAWRCRPSRRCRIRRREPQPAGHGSFVAGFIRTIT
jgi:hypothetical protein